jgi:Helix-turn-helix domain
MDVADFVSAGMTPPRKDITVSTATDEHFREGVPELEGWRTMAQAARRFGISKQGVHKMVSAGSIKTLHRIGKYYVLKTSEVEDIAKARANPTLPIG